jgi:hypothetical protein
LGEAREITNLPALLRGLPPGERAAAERVFEVSATTGRLVAPEGMRPWIAKTFGSVEAAEEQRIVRVTNKATLEGTLFNGLRASRPLDTGMSADLEGEIRATEGDPFCRPEEGTPADTFGRARGRHSVTASNVAKYDGFHGVVVFDDHNPLDLTPEKVSDYISVALEWLRRAREEDPEAVYPFLMWNCLWRAGGSIIHGHAQVAATRGSHYPKVERLRRDARAYSETHAADYFEDLWRVHDALGLSFLDHDGARGFASLTPVKEKELVLVGRDAADEGFRRAVGETLRRYVRDLGASAFNVAFYLPPPPGAGVPEDWSSFPVLAYVVDRGDPSNRTSDVAAMELYAASVVASDPFAVARVLRDGFSR